jgi:alginate O-acetyltransferase complex protein AlgF
MTVSRYSAVGDKVSVLKARRGFVATYASGFAAIGAFATMALTSATTQAQPAGQLYDPEPPLDSAYVRLVVLNLDSASEVSIDGRVRVAKLGTAEVSDYLVLAAGKRTIAIKGSDKTATRINYVLDVTAGKALTLAFTVGEAQPKLFEDKANTNKLKSLVAAYHLDPKAGAVTVSTADGATKVFPNLAFGTSNSLQVNPIAIELVATKAGAAANAGNKFGLTMTAGANYSVFLIPNAQGNLTARAVQNKTERYVTK